MLYVANYFKCISTGQLFKPGARRPQRAWFLKVDPVQIVSMCVCLRVCVRPRGY